MAKTLIQIGVLHRDLDEPGEGIARLADAIEILHTGGEPRLLMIALHDLACLLLRSGQPAQALYYTQRARVLLEVLGTRLDRLRFDWVAARAMAEIGRPRAAAAIFERLRAAYLEADFPYEAALVSLELAVAELHLGRRPKVHALAEETARLFGRLGVDREATAALRLLADLRLAEAAERVAEIAAAVRRLRPLRSGCPFD